MAKVKKAENVPEIMRGMFDAIVDVTNDFCKVNLNEEYAQLIRYAVAALCRKRPSPLATGKVNTWACGITYAIGTVNFLFDKSQTPNMTASDLCYGFGVGKSTGQGKSKLVRDMLKTYPLDPNWSLTSKLDSNPMIWTLSVNGLLVDVRGMSRDIQEIAFEKGLIPYIPADKKSN